jgi:hypothetical protein
MHKEKAVAQVYWPWLLKCIIAYTFRKKGASTFGVFGLKNLDIYEFYTVLSKYNLHHKKRKGGSLSLQYTEKIRKEGEKESNILATKTMNGGISRCNLLLELSTILKHPKAVRKRSLLVKIIGSGSITYGFNCMPR